MTPTNGQWFRAIINAFVEASDAFRVILGDNSGVDVGDVTVNNAAGAGVYTQPGTGATREVI